MTASRAAPKRERPPGTMGWQNRLTWLGFVAGAVACRPSAGEAPVAATALPSTTSAGAAPSVPGPAPRRRRLDAVATNRECERCHEAIAEEWRGSLHHRSNTDEAYRQQFAVEPLPFCTRCHAPEAEPNDADGSPAGALGVGCVTCHVVNGTIVGGRSPSEAPHPVSTHLDLRGPDGCGACHEFGFPSTTFAEAGLAMQSTMTEHSESAFAARSCADCHMPWRLDRDGRRHLDHRFAASRDPTMVRSAVVVEPRGWEASTWRLSLRPGRIGHAFPTGDMLRQLTLTVEVRDRAGQLVDGHERVLKRHFEHRRRPHQAPRLHEVRDDRVAPRGPTMIEVDLARPSGGSLFYRLTYDRVADPRATGGERRYHGRITVAEGIVALDTE